MDAMTDRGPSSRKSKDKMSFSVNFNDSSQPKFGKKKRKKSRDEKSQESVSINMNLVMPPQQQNYPTFSPKYVG